MLSLHAVATLFAVEVSEKCNAASTGRMLDNATSGTGFDAISKCDSAILKGLLKVKPGKAQREYMFSGAPPATDFVSAVGTSIQCH
jgi:hypothetical protein